MGNNETPGCLGRILSLFLGEGSGRQRNERRTRAYPYRVRDSFLTPAELSFYHVLRIAVGDRAEILSKVGLWDIFYVARPNEHRGAKAHIDRKHVDFLLCDPQSMQPIVAIELDDSSHRKAERRLRDAQVDLVFETADLPLIHVPAKRAYVTDELTSQLAPYLDNGAEPVTARRTDPPAATQVDTEGTPLCPKCGMPMVIRVASRGQHQGERFYACPNYPKCKSVSPVR